MDAFALWKQEVDAEQDRLENTGQQLSEAEQLRRIDTYWVSVVRDIQADDPYAFGKIETIRAFAGRADGEYPLTYAALRSLPRLDTAPSLARMRREIAEAADDLYRRNPSASSHDLVDMMDGKLTNYISDLRKDDPKYLEKKKYFKDLLWSGMLPNAAATFERKGHGTPYSMDRIREEAIAARQARQGGRRTRRRGGNPTKTEVSNPAWNIPKPKPATVVVSNPIASLPRPPKPNPAAGTGLFTGGRRKTLRRRRRRTGGMKPADNKLLEAIYSQSVPEVKAALAEGADPNGVNPEDHNRMFSEYAFDIVDRDIRRETIKALMKSGLNLTQKSEFSENTPLINAVHKDDDELVQMMIDGGSPVDAKGSEGGTALYWAVDNMPLNPAAGWGGAAGRIQRIMKMLMKAGANPQLVYDALAAYPEALAEAKTKIERIRNPAMAIEVGVKKELPTPLPGKIRGFLGSSRRRRQRS
jgi:hypothetical protein